MSNQQTFFLRWNNHHNALVQELDSLLLSAALVDCTIAAEGQYINVHKVVLCACSPYFQALLSQPYEKYPIVILNNIGIQELKLIVNYMYKGEVNVPQDQMQRFFKACELLQIRGLADRMASDNQLSGVSSTLEETRESNYSNQPLMLPEVSNRNDVLPTTSNLVGRSSENRTSISSSQYQEELSKRLTGSQVSGGCNFTNSSHLPAQSEISVINAGIRNVPSNSLDTVTNIPDLVEGSADPQTVNELPVIFIPKTELVIKSVSGSTEDVTMAEYNGLLECNIDDTTHDETDWLNGHDIFSIPVNRQSDERPKKRTTSKKTLRKTSKKRVSRKKYTTHPCPNNCGRSYKAKTSMERHFTIECGKEATHLCSHCPSRFYYEKSLKNHEKTH